MDPLKSPPGSSLLIFSVEAGSGHRRAAQALQQALERHGQGVAGIVEDAYDYCPPWVYRSIIGSYLQMLDRAPGLYRLLFTQGESPSSAQIGKGAITGLMKSTGGDKMAERIRRLSPHAVVCTHPFPLGVLVKLRRMGRIDVPLYGVVTDFTVHPFWVFPEADGYFLAHEGMVEAMTRLGVPESRCHVTGIPVDEAFGRSYDRGRVRAALGLDPDQFTVLVMGGSLGMGPVVDLVKALFGFGTPLQLIVVAGHNEDLRRQLTTLAAQRGLPMAVVGFVDNVHELMAASDLFLTKPGGLSVYEGLVSALPLVLLDPLPGQEERNAEVLTELGVAVKAPSIGELPPLLEGLLRQPERLAAMTEKARAFGRKDSSRLAMERILKGGSSHDME